MALVGELVRTGDVAYTSPIFRQADSATFKFDVVARDGTTAPTVEIKIFHKNAHDGDWNEGTPVATISNITTTGVQASSSVTGLKEMIRAKVSTTAGSKDGWARIVFLAPVWNT